VTFSVYWFTSEKLKIQNSEVDTIFESQTCELTWTISNIVTYWKIIFYQVFAVIYLSASNNSFWQISISSSFPFIRKPLFGDTQFKRCSYTICHLYLQLVLFLPQRLFWRNWETSIIWNFFHPYLLSIRIIASRPERKLL